MESQTVQISLSIDDAKIASVGLNVASQMTNRMDLQPIYERLSNVIQEAIDQSRSPVCQESAVQPSPSGDKTKTSGSVFKGGLSSPFANRDFEQPETTKQNSESDSGKSKPGRRINTKVRENRQARLLSIMKELNRPARASELKTKLHLGNDPAIYAVLRFACENGLVEQLEDKKWQLTRKGRK